MHRLRTVLAFLVSAAACSPGEQADVEETPVEEARVEAPGVVDVVARGLTLEAPDELQPGWTTFRFANLSPMTHFVVVERVPEGQGLESQQEEIAPVFQEGMDLLAAGDVDGAMVAFGKLPAWFGEIVFMGGPGLTGPGLTSQATVHLEPGTYLLECYVKTNGIFHSYNPDPAVYGMVHEFRVAGEESTVAEPTATVALAISSDGGIEMTGTPVAGAATVSVDFTDQTVHENFVGHDVHLVRIADGVDLEVVEQWMDWTRPDGLQTPAPAEFLGGLNEMPAGGRGYFTVELAPGRYAWVAEVPGSSAKGMLKPFTVE